MNLPFTMTAEQAAAAVQELPTFVYPYHYRGGDDGTRIRRPLPVGDAR